MNKVQTLQNPIRYDGCLFYDGHSRREISCSVTGATPSRSAISGGVRGSSRSDTGLGDSESGTGSGSGGDCRSSQDSGVVRWNGYRHFCCCGAGS